MSAPGQRASPLQLLASTLPVALILLAVIAYGNGELVHAQLLKLGEWSFSGYHELRVDPEKPKCDPASFVVPDAPTQTSTKTSTKTAEDGNDEDLLPDEDDDDDEDLLPDDEEKPKTAAKAKDPDKDDDGDDDDLLPDDDDDDDDLLGDDDDDDLLGEDDGPSREAIIAAKKLCESKHAAFAKTQDRLTTGVKVFRAFERSVAGFVGFGVDFLRHALALLLLICAATATSLRGHIALRPMESRLDHRVSTIAQLLANGLLLFSAWALKRVDETSGIQVEHGELHLIWIAGLSVLVVLNIIQLVKLPADAKTDGSFGHALLCVPLYATMSIISGVYFLVVEGHLPGLAIYLAKLTEHAILYIHVGLYVWVGMLLKQTRVAPLAFDVVRPWKLPPELLAFVAVVAAALPTAYSGASGIFVIAAGGVIYEELRRAGSRNQLALAATAMSGSMGVVLRPCLLVVIVASLNKQVTTDQLYSWGFKVFLLSATLFLVASLLNRQGPLRVEKAGVALPGMIDGMKALLPYGLIFGGILVADYLLLNAHLDEHSAPVTLPVILIAILIYDRRAAKRAEPDKSTTSTEAPVGFIGSVERATTETTGHIGALLMLMGMSIALGGIIERADVMALVPHSLGSVWLTMSVLVVVLVLIGMTMDPYGAVILVSATIADVAYRNGIDPVHFWMTVLVAFELGYLTPPVALNHLLTRQVVGEDASTVDDLPPNASVWARYERILLPISVMGVALLIVAFAPLLFG